MRLKHWRPRSSETQSELAEAVEAAQEVAAYEPEEDETVTATRHQESPQRVDRRPRGQHWRIGRARSCKPLQAQETAITALEKRIKESKAELKILTDELEHQAPAQAPRVATSSKLRVRRLLCQVDAQLAALDSANKDGKKKITALQKDKAALQLRASPRPTPSSPAIGGQLTKEEAKPLILKKLYDLAGNELNRYLNAEKRRLIAVVENLWDKYAVSSRELEQERSETLKTLDGFLRGLGYLGEGAAGEL